ncbi:Uncharacterised protein [Streptococcus pneumoniae]|nr:Uncharacterised protein [Streptococcus pneumoniae]CJH26691.1 Uncharacterised protein [Streptococcus pneumoniae]CJH36204.1 Uncharacterised protein [Streptococcus pneumoniae]CJI42186.1 Uncharacterised protein [Streptococcus pneumoniae]
MRSNLLVGMTSKIYFPIASSFLYPIIRSALLLKRRTCPSRSITIMPSCVEFKINSPCCVCSSNRPISPSFSCANPVTIFAISPGIRRVSFFFFSNKTLCTSSSPVISNITSICIERNGVTLSPIAIPYSLAICSPFANGFISIIPII